MQSAEATTGRRILVVLEPGDEILGSLAEACRLHDIDQAVITTFSGALRQARIIAADRPAVDPEAPLPESATVAYTEGVGSGTITRGTDGAHAVHVHVALGVKDRSGLAFAGHLLEGETHYVIEVVLDEILTPRLSRAPHPDSSGIPILRILDDAAPASGRPTAP
jgi:predicted DNA-binding protein with PD1-like motif